jgi:Tfp pilus assembly protein PilN
MGSPNELSFLPDDYLQRKATRRANALCAGLSLVVMGAMASAFWLTERSMKGVEAKAAAVDQTFADAARSIDQVNKMKAQQRKIVHQAELAASLVERVPRSNLLAEFTNALPSGASLLDLSLESRLKVSNAAVNEKSRKQQQAAAAAAGPAQAEPVKYDVVIKLTGVADSDVQVAQFMNRLNNCPLVSDVNLLVTAEFKQGDREMRKFQIEMMQNPTAEVKDEARNTGTEVHDSGTPAATTPKAKPAAATATKAKVHS